MADTNTSVVALVDVVFAIVGFSYGSQVLHPIPMTYLSEITFPMDFCVKLMSSMAILSIHTLHWSLDVWRGPYWHQRDSLSATASTNAASHVFFEMLAWGVATTLLWMEHRRSRSPSLLLRFFWLFSWISVSMELFAHEHVTQLDIGTASSLVIIMAAISYSCSALLGASCFFAATPVTTDMIDLPLITTPSAFLHSTNFKMPLSSYGTFGNYGDAFSRNSSALRTKAESKENDNDQELDERTLITSQASSHHSFSRGATITATIPSSTTSIWGKNHFISYKIIVQTEDDQWSVRRQYSDFVSLHEELPETVQAQCPLPKDETNRQYMSWKHRPTPLKTRLEKYLQRVLSHRDLEPYASQALCDFLEMEYIDDSLLQFVYSGPLTGSSWVPATQQS